MSKPDPSVITMPTGVLTEKLSLDESTIHTNTGQEFIFTTADKIELCLIKHKDQLKAKTGWKTPLGISITLVVTLLASDFKNFLGITSQQWYSMFFFGFVISIGWLIYSIYRALKYFRKNEIESIIDNIKTG